MSAGARASRDSLRPVRMPTLAEELDAHALRSRLPEYPRDLVGPLGVAPVGQPTEVIWEAPPSGGRGRGTPPPWLAELKSHTQAWARIPVVTGSNCSYALKKRFPGLEVTAAKHSHGKFWHWARWMGEPE